MARNLELKIKVDSHDKIEEQLKLINAEQKGILNQKDIYYKWDKGLLKLRVQNKSYQLIKYIRNENGAERFSNYEIIELSGNDAEIYLRDILNIEVEVEKKRNLYIYKNTRVHLDNVKNLGMFLELETVVVSEQQNVQGEFDEVIKLLNLNLNSQILCSYRDMMIEAR